LAEVFRSSLAVGGIDGTLRRRFRDPNVKGTVTGKTGTLTGIIALSGFVTNTEGRELCFSIVSNGHRHRRRRNVRDVHEDMVVALKQYLESAPLAVASAPTSTPEVEDDNSIGDQASDDHGEERPEEAPLP
jgi:hypothetical protein